MSDEKVTKPQALGMALLGLVLGPVILYFNLNDKMPKQESLQELTIIAAQQGWEGSKKKKKTSKSFVIHHTDDTRYSVPSYVSLMITHDGRKRDGYESLLKQDEPVTIWVEQGEKSIWQMKQGDTMLLSFKDCVKDHRSNNKIGLIMGAIFTVIGLICLGLLLFAPARYWEP